ncbi:TonB-dependent receptor [Lysobacter enzymogenes]|uniref:TonB-dependent receptor n=1 Tax=Lysobacter enzymogenes TaxID=69 RepID=UPI0019D0C99C|nr:TonB-dependent receptor [Lysobacter enzymogenes]MBN7138763.1 TonB-dependent receptor [Lysobacter enzymogenes]
MKARKTLLSASIVAALSLASGVAMAQDAPAAAAQAKDLDAVVVTGIRASLEKSLDTKRANVTVSEAITAEDIGKFANTNVAEAMSQIPGVVLDRRFGQGERVSIDGTDPSLNLSFLDGHPVAQSIWLYGEQPNRGFDYTLLAPEILGRLEVIKSSEARLTEGSLGGTVLMHTRKPLDMDANSIAGSLSFNYNDQGGDTRPSGSFMYSWKNADENFGFNFAAQHYEETVDRQGVEVFGYVKANTFPNQTGAAANIDVPNFVNAAWFQQTRERNSANLNLQFKPSNELEFNLSGLFIRESFDNYNQSFYNFLTQRPGAVDRLSTSGNVATGGHSNANPVFYDNNVRASEPETKGIDLTGKYQTDAWGVSGQIGHSKSENSLEQWFIEPVYTGGYSFDLKRGLTFDNPAAAGNPANWAGDGFMGNYGVIDTETKDTYGQVDFNVRFDSVFNNLSFGARRGKHEEDYRQNVYVGLPVADLNTVGTINPVSLRDLNAGSGRHIQVGRQNVIDYVNRYRGGLTPDPASFLNNTFSIEQTNTAAYVQADFSAGGFRGNLGVRYVESKTDGEGFAYGGTPSLTDLDSKRVRSSKKEDFVLPSLNVVYDTGSDVLLRFGAAKVVAWAPYNQLVGNTFLNDSTFTGSGGSANLDAYESTNYSLSAEWYFAEQSVLAASVFYKDIDNYITSEAAIERQFNSNATTAPAFYQSRIVGTNGCTTDGFCNYSILRPVNAGKGKVKGFTVSYQQPFGDTGFGLTANYTYADGEGANGTDLPYQSRDAVAISPYYERGPLSARISYNWRSDYLAGGYVAGAPPASVDDYAELGASVSWTFDDRLTVALEGMNLLDSEYKQYLGREELVAQRFHTGRRFMASFRFKF